MKRATKADVFYIQNNPENLDVPALAKITGLSNSQINRIIAQKPESQELPESQSQSKSETQFLKSSIRVSQAGKHKVFVMTQGASEVADASRQTNQPKDNSKHICKARK